MEKISKRTGFTLIELIIVIAIIAILAAVAVPNYLNVMNRAKISTDISNLYILNNVTRAYRFTENITTDDVFDGILVDENRMQKLVDSKYLNDIITPAKQDTSFYWNVDSQKWLYSLFELAGASTNYSFSGLSLDNFLKTGNWNIDSDGFVSSYGMLFVDNNNSEYTITTTAQLDEGTYGGYGILFETSLSDPDHDTGYVLQFDRGYGGIVIRPRIDGSEKSPLLVLKNSDSSIIPSSKRDEWWSDEHEVTMKVQESDSGTGTKTLTAWIDGTEIVSDWSFESDTESENNFTGFRSWGTGTVYKDIDIE